MGIQKVVRIVLGTWLESILARNLIAFYPCLETLMVAEFKKW